LGIGNGEEKSRMERRVEESRGEGEKTSRAKYCRTEPTRGRGHEGKGRGDALIFIFDSAAAAAAN